MVWSVFWHINTLLMINHLGCSSFEPKNPHHRTPHECNDLSHQCFFYFRKNKINANIKFFRENTQYLDNIKIMIPNNYRQIIVLWKRKPYKRKILGITIMRSLTHKEIQLSLITLLKLNETCQKSINSRRLSL